jgi:hypothetical protein
LVPIPNANYFEKNSFPSKPFELPFFTPSPIEALCIVCIC